MLELMVTNGVRKWIEQKIKMKGKRKKKHKDDTNIGVTNFFL